MAAPAAERKDDLEREEIAEEQVASAGLAEEAKLAVSDL